MEVLGHNQCLVIYYGTVKPCEPYHSVTFTYVKDAFGFGTTMCPKRRYYDTSKHIVHCTRYSMEEYQSYITIAALSVRFHFT